MIICYHKHCVSARYADTFRKQPFPSKTNQASEQISSPLPVGRAYWLQLSCQKNNNEYFKNWKHTQRLCTAFRIVVNKVPLGSKPRQPLPTHKKSEQYCSELALESVYRTDFAKPICTSDGEDESSSTDSERSPLFFNQILPLVIEGH